MLTEVEGTQFLPGGYGGRVFALRSGLEDFLELDEGLAEEVGDAPVLEL